MCFSFFNFLTLYFTLHWMLTLNRIYSYYLKPQPFSRREFQATAQDIYYHWYIVQYQQQYRCSTYVLGTYNYRQKTSLLGAQRSMGCLEDHLVERSMKNKPPPLPKMLSRRLTHTAACPVQLALNVQCAFNLTKLLPFFALVSIFFFFA